MMETKLWAALCALLLMNLASAENDESHAVPSPASESVPGIPAAESVPTSSLDPISLAATTPSPNGTDTSSSVTSSLSSNTATEGKPISLTPEPKKDNGTGIVSPSVAAGPEQNGTDPTTSQPPSPPSGTDGPTSHIPLTSTTISPTHTTHQAASAHTDSITNQPTNPETHTPTSVATPEPAKHEITTTPTITTTQSSSTSSTSSSQESPNSESSTLAPPQNTSGPDGHLETSSVAHQKTAIIPPSSPSAHADTPSQLNVGGDTTMVHESPTLDPLLAGLVSAFIITAVIITLLLFLKLRRRDNRPEFRRLQDLPMDDMMEDTPLSMYSY